MKEKFDLLGQAITKALEQKPSRVKVRGVVTPLKKYRVSQKLTGREAAERLGLSYRNYNRLENKPLDQVPTAVLLLVKLGALDNPNNRESVLEWWKIYDSST